MELDEKQADALARVFAEAALRQLIAELKTPEPLPTARAPDEHDAMGGRRRDES